MESVATLTMNPAVDLTTETERLVIGRKTRCRRELRESGGGGINVARGLALLGCPVTAIFPSGGAPGQLLEELLAEAGVPTRLVQVDGALRENVSLFERATGNHYHLVFPGPELSETEWRRCADAVLSMDPPPRYLVLSGSLPPGVPVGFFADLARQASARDMRVILDTSGEPLRRAAADGHLFALKPNRTEFRQAFAVNGDRLADLLPPMEALVREGRAEVVMVTLGAEGALLVTREQRCHLCPPRVTGESPVGAGDSFTALFVHTLAQGRTPLEACRYGVAAAAAAVTTPGTTLYRSDDVERLVRYVTTEPVRRAGQPSLV